MRVVLMILMAWALLAGCGGAPAQSTVPVYTGATPVAAGGNTWADSMATSMEGLVNGQKVGSIQRYRLPAGTTWDQVKQFYGQQLSGWTPLSDYDVDNDTLNTRAWAAPGGNTLLVAFTEDSVGGSGTYLLTGEFAK